MAKKAKAAAAVSEPVRLDFGCGPNKKAGFLGVDCIDFPGVDVVVDIGAGTWPWGDDTVEEAHASHFLEHLTNLHDKWERVHFFNELYRVLKPGAKASLIFPHWNSNRYYGDPTHKEPFSEMGFYYLSRAWRDGNAPHTDIAHNPHGYDCNFEATWGYAVRQDLISRNQEYQQYALTNFKDAAQDIIATLTKA